MPKQVYIVAGWLTLIIALTGSVLYSKHLRGQFEDVNTQFAALRGMTSKWTNELAAIKADFSQNETRLKQLEQEKSEVENKQKKMEDEMRGALESRDVTISQLQGKLTVSILDRVLFDSGEAVLKPDGEAVLGQIAAALSQYTNRLIHVIGHTDNVPIRGKGRHIDNWDLSAARATAAVRYLSEKAGVDPTRLAAVGQGEFHPLADNSTPEGRARNRRIALVVLPEDFRASDVPLPTNAPAGPAGGVTTNAPAAAPR